MFYYGFIFGIVLTLSIFLWFAMSFSDEQADLDEDD